MERIVLVVDDNPELVDGVKLTLEMEGYQVLAAIAGQEALDILERITPDLILADIMMPGMDGYELYERVHQDERWVQVPFIFLTAKTAKADIRRGKEMGADDYITKPFDPEDVVAAVRGRLKRMAEVTGRPAPGDVVGNLKQLWKGKLGPLPVPLVALAALAAIVLLVAVPILALRGPASDDASLSDSPLRPRNGSAHRDTVHLRRRSCCSWPRNVPVPLRPVSSRLGRSDPRSVTERAAHGSGPWPDRGRCGSREPPSHPVESQSGRRGPGVAAHQAPGAYRSQGWTRAARTESPRACKRSRGSQR